MIYYMYILYDYYLYIILYVYIIWYIYIEILRIDMIGYDSLWYYMIYEGELANFAPPFARFWTSNPPAMVEGQNWVPPRFHDFEYDQWEFQDPKMEVLYHIRPYFGGISRYILLHSLEMAIDMIKIHF